MTSAVPLGDAESTPAAGSAGPMPATLPGGLVGCVAAPGGMEEILTGPRGPQIGAVFDLDGTLVAGYTAMVFAGDRYRRRQVGAGEFARTVALGAGALAGRAGLGDLIALGVSTWKGRSVEEVDALGERLFVEKIADRIYPESVALLEAHRAMGHTVVLASSATRFQVMPVARYLGIEHVLQTELEVDADGLLTGRALEATMWGEGKARAVQAFAADAGIDLDLSYFYADGDEDEPLMHLVGNPRPTNPGRRLASVANRRGWPVRRYASRGGGAQVALARNLAGVAAAVGAGALATGAGLLNGDRRLAVDVATPAAVDLLLAAAGVRVRAVGEEHLLARRPAVFIWNHCNNFDPVVVAKLVRSRFTGVAKKELRRDPLFGVAGPLLDVVFVDREDSAKAVASLAPLDRLIAGGLSVLIAPEGTRSPDGNLGPFKKGAFRIAMTAGIPIVPVVVRNALVLGPRNAAYMRPGTVDVVVLPPIDVSGWDPDDLDARVAEVRQLFVDTLADWPGTFS